MVSRRKILSRSRDELNTIRDYPEDDEDAWYLKESLYKDHIQEVLVKWEQLDDEIWSKIICMERNRRVAKAYARAEELTINGSEDGFNGFRIGLNGFENPMRDAKTAEIKRYIGNGIRMKMDDNGNVLVKRSSRSPVYIMGIENKDEHSIGAEITKNGGEIAPNKALKLFDMKRFQSNIDKELRQAYPDRKKLEYQCIISVCFVGKGQNMLDSPCWVMIINVVALDMLKRKLPTAPRYGNDKKLYSRPRLPIPFEEDPYSLPGNANNGNGQNNNGIYSKLPSKETKPPKLPPRDFNSKKKLMTVPEPDYDENNDKPRNKKRSGAVKKISKIEDEDPYYCGMLARVPNYNKKNKNQQQQAPMPKKSSRSSYSSSNGAYDIYGYIPRMPTMYSTGNPYSMYGSSLYRSVDSLIDTHNRHEEIYSHIYGSRLRMPTAAPSVPFGTSRGNAYVGNWE